MADYKVLKTFIDAKQVRRQSGDVISDDDYPEITIKHYVRAQMIELAEVKKTRKKKATKPEKNKADGPDSNKAAE